MTDQTTTSGRSSAPAAEELQRFLQDEQDFESVRDAFAKVSQILTRGEEILYIAVQHKPVNITPKCVVLTTRRFIIFQPKLLGRAAFEDYIWRELGDAELKEDLIGATLSLKTVDDVLLSVAYLPKAQARRLYAIAQEMEEEMVEERRRRDMEERRAEAGGIYLPSAPAVAETQADPVKVLQQLKDMVDAGLIAPEEYQAKKKEVLSRM
ncbi:MAG: PH domain-containing protein [Anaerolineae bacterium]|nr:PH domain-containing protein [Anaerolineae bacterium]